MKTSSTSIDLSTLAGGSRRIYLEQRISLEPAGAYRFPSPVEVVARVERQGEVVDVYGSAQTHAAGLCDRCLEEYSTPLVVQIDEQLALGAAGDPLGDSNVIQDGHLDLADLVRQLISAELPYTSRCRDDCAGLCTTCGMNRNEGSCSCEAATKGDHG